MTTDAGRVKSLSTTLSYSSAYISSQPLVTARAEASQFLHTRSRKTTFNSHTPLGVVRSLDVAFHVDNPKVRHSLMAIKAQGLRRSRKASSIFLVRRRPRPRFRVDRASSQLDRLDCAHGIERRRPNAPRHISRTLTKHENSKMKKWKKCRRTVFSGAAH